MNAAERQALAPILERAASAVEAIAEQGLEAAMNRYNQRGPAGLKLEITKCLKINHSVDFPAYPALEHQGIGALVALGRIIFASRSNGCVFVQMREGPGLAPVGHPRRAVS